MLVTTPPLTSKQDTPLAGCFAESRMVESIARIRFFWSPDKTKCRATAYDISDEVLGEVTIELPEQTRHRISATRGGGMQLRIEELAERHLRTMLDLRY